MREAPDVAICSGLGVVRGLSLCSGIGGLDLGLKRAIPGYRAICYVERELYPASVLVTRMEAGDLRPAPVYSDLRTFDGLRWRGCVDILSAGYPCQPFSCAGKKRGADDPRHLWPEVFRIIREVRPRLIFLENVPGHVRLGLSDVLGDLASVGLDAEWDIFSAAETGAPHLRRRLFILAYSDDPGRGEQRDPEPNEEEHPAIKCSGPPSDTSGAELRDEQGRERGTGRGGAAISGDNGEAGIVADADRGRLQVERLAESHGQQSTLRGQSHGCGQVREQQHTPESSKRRGSQPGMGRALPDGLSPWMDEPRDLPRVATGTSYRVDRLRALGNAVVPAQAALAFRELAERARA